MERTQRVALITGTGSGIGRACAQAFVAEGATVFGADLDPISNQQTAELLGPAFTPSLAIDLRDASAVSEWVSGVAQTAGRIDVLVPAGGATRFGAIGDVSLAQWQEVLSLELDVVFNPLKAAWPHLISSRGSVVLIGSTAGVAGSVTNDRIAHSAGKGGVIAMARQIAAEGAKHGVRANCVSPGVIATNATASDILAPDHPMSQIAKAIPLGRTGGANEVAAAVAFLASDKASYITGANLMVDGGWSAVLPGANL
jgi:meso-butanediol dehydrogenase / (S,S)-butanediol dehydrogenase / diacetyl reductase